ncbi:MAG: GntR family transcriptional regulator [Deltaproteobacteria bacterium]|nr:MAG: GntR family transcriptional regulator [Deltaproteobacteria bacterium]
MAPSGEHDSLAKSLKGFVSPPQRTSLGQYVYDTVKHAVVSGDVAPGTRMVESRLAEALGISRTPVREAFYKLEREHLVRRSPAGGFFVVGLTRADVEETFGIRSVLESYAARLAALKHRDSELEPLQKKIREYQEQFDKGQLDALPKINTEFHDLLYGLSRSPRLVKMINDLRDLIFRFRQVILKRQEMARLSNEDHLRMLEHMRKRDADKVEKLVREHILRGQEVVLKIFDEEFENTDG